VECRYGGGSSLVHSLPDPNVLTPWLYGPLRTLARMLILLHYLRHAFRYSVSTLVTHFLHIPVISIWPLPLFSFLLVHFPKIS
jgi:hypothetical protein